MAIIKTIKVSVGYTKNAGNYESVRVEESLEADLQEGESCTAALDECREFLRQKVMADAKAHVKYMKSQR